MAEAMESAVARIGALEDEGPLAGPELSLSVGQVGALWQAGAWPGRQGTVAETLAAAAGASEAPAPGRSVRGGQARLVRTEALKWWLVAEGPLAPPGIGIEDGTVLDLSHARTRILVEGPRARDLIARFAAIDLRADRFAVDAAAMTGTHGIGFLLMRTGADAFELWPLRSLARALWDDLAEVGAQFGLAPA